MRLLMAFLILVSSRALFAEECETQLQTTPRQIDPARTFDALVDWIHDELIVNPHAPGFVIGLSGTDSILVYLASAKAFAREGRPERVVGIHYDDANEPSWFQTEVIPWLRTRTPACPRG